MVHMNPIIDRLYRTVSSRRTRLKIRSLDSIRILMVAPHYLLLIILYDYKLLTFQGYFNQVNTERLIQNFMKKVQKVIWFQGG